MTVVLHEEVRERIEQCLLELYPLWRSRALHDQRRTIRPIERWHFTIGVERYSGWRSTIAFEEAYKDASAIVRLEEAIRAHHPALLGYIVKPHRASRIERAYGWVIAWCLYLDAAMSAAASLQEGIAKLLADLAVLLRGHATQRGVIVLRGLSVDTADPDIILRKADAALGEVRLHRLSDEEFTELTAFDIEQGPSFDIRMIPKLAVAHYSKPTSIGFALEEPAKQGPNPFERELRDIAGLIQSSLHVAKSGCVGIVEMRTEYLPQVAPAMSGGGFAPPQTGFMYSLDVADSDREVIRECLEHLSDCRPELLVAARKLVDAEMRVDDHEVVLDTAIGLETLLNAEGQELTFRLRLNYAFLGAPAERRERADKMREFYTLRSQLVHGRQVKDEQKLSAMARFGKGALRETIGTFLADPVLRKNGKLDADFWLDRIISARS